MAAPRHSRSVEQAEHVRSAPTPVHATDLLPASTGHAAIGRAPPTGNTRWIENQLGRVNAAFRWSRKTGRECGFLAYQPQNPDADPIPEAMSQGTRTEITWRWEHADATVAYTFHTHPGRNSVPVPSGLDVLGAIVRGDHVHYILDMRGRLVGWRFRDADEWPRACQETLKCLSDQQQLDGAFVDFLKEALEGMVPHFMEPCYGARVELMDDGKGALLTSVDPRTLVNRY